MEFLRWLFDLVTKDFPPWVSNLANVLEIFGFALTLWVLRETFLIRRDFALRGRVPDQKKSLANAAKKLPPLLRVWPSQKSDVLTILAEVRSVLENLGDKLSGREKAAVLALVSDLRKQKVRMFRYLPISNYVPISEYDSTQIWKVFTDLQGVVSSLEQREKDTSWK